jgi:hypothetical protein
LGSITLGLLLVELGEFKSSGMINPQQLVELRIFSATL